MRAAFTATVASDAFLADARKQNVPVNPATGEEAEKIIAAIYTAPPELVAKARDAIK